MSSGSALEKIGPQPPSFSNNRQKTSKVDKMVILCFRLSVCQFAVLVDWHGSAAR